MTTPFEVGVVDLMVALPPAPGDETWRDQLRPLLKDRESADFAHPASYLYRNLPAARYAPDPVSAVLDEMDRFGVDRAMVGVHPDNAMGLSYETIFEQLPAVPFREQVWPQFLRANALRLLGETPPD
jgi:hypothetical protein